MKKTKNCQKCGREFEKHYQLSYKQWKVRKFCSKKCFGASITLPPKEKKLRIAWNKGLKGYHARERNHLWKGGVTSVREQIRKSLEYKYWRSLCMQRDFYTCQDCGSKGVYLEVDHIVPFAKILQDNHITTLNEAFACEALWNINNGKTLCKPCHKQTDSYGWKTRWNFLKGRVTK